MQLFSNEDSEAAQDPLTRMIASIDVELQNEIKQADGKLFVRAIHPSEYEDGDEIRVDLAKPLFEMLYQGSVTSCGSCQLIGTWRRDDGSFVWGFANPSISTQATSEVKSFVDQTPDLDAVGKSNGFYRGWEDVYLLSRFIALKLNYLGCYPAEVNESTVALLAVNLGGAADGPTRYGEAHNRWCKICGQWSTNVAHLIAGARGDICNSCIDQYQEQVQFMDLDGQGTPPANMVHCFLCNENVPRVFLPWCSVCPGCLDTAKSALP